MKWERNGVSVELEELLEDFKHSNLPLGIIVFGADSGLKAKVFKLLRGRIGKPLGFNRRGLDGYIGQVRTSLKKGQPVIICMHGDDSAYTGLRHQIADRLRRSGASTIIGIYVKATKADKIDFSAMRQDPSFDHQAYYRQLEKLEIDPPMPSRVFNRFIIVQDDDFDPAV